eukprot:TRINITY_DN1238_c0_g1_i2.p1 TRINITY_DN1238_c0_g1~~TRINITY_DN1238_c0_g1_i2.p1  ORF type:complete len:239 (+),score=25.99 TRINITY_DN1238_c0_g1_i2:37-717(+)
MNDIFNGFIVEAYNALVNQNHGQLFPEDLEPLVSLTLGDIPQECSPGFITHIEGYVTCELFPDECEILHNDLAGEEFFSDAVLDYDDGNYECIAELQNVYSDIEVDGQTNAGGTFVCEDYVEELEVECTAVGGILCTYVTEVTNCDLLTADFSHTAFVCTVPGCASHVPYPFYNGSPLTCGNNPVVASVDINCEGQDGVGGILGGSMMLVASHITLFACLVTLFTC